MAVNNGCPDCRKMCEQPTNGDGNEEAHALRTRRTASPASGRSSPTIYNPFYTGRPRTPANGGKTSPIDRQEIIRRIKSNGSRPTSPELEKASTVDRQELMRRVKGLESRHAPAELDRHWAEQKKRKSPSPRPSTPVHAKAGQKSPDSPQDNQSVGLQIERPRSALHRGDFREREQAATASFEQLESARLYETAPRLSTSPVAPWHSDFPAFQTTRDLRQESQTAQHGLAIAQTPLRDRALSNVSLATSFTYKPPTSPLVQSSRPDTPELPKSPSPDRSRRHTFSPQSFRSFQTALEYPTSARIHNRPAPPLRSEKTFPYQAHQPRRSLHNTPFSSLPHTPIAGARRPSITADSPIQHAPMVGSYEESILRGRMSTIPSRPLNFMAQIGVLGKGNCRSNLRCPPHVSVPFPAVFYSYGHSGKTPANDQPSPYVGLVDLENNLVPFEDARDKRREQLRSSRSHEGSRNNSPRGARDEGSTSDATRKQRRQKGKRRSGSPKAPPGGSYRIPQQGQLQIVIKNPNKTAVKLFLIPYDLSNMEPGQKTFIRQRSYSAGPIIDMPLSSRSNLGTDRPEAALNPTGDPNDRPTLRYLIHLHICCPSKGRFFLYKSVRVVFANRVPDGKEKLRNEVQMPEPKYSAYKPGRDSNVGINTAPPQKLNARRRSVMVTNDKGWSSDGTKGMAQSLPAADCGPQFEHPPPPLPRHFTTLPTLESRPSSQQYSDWMDMDRSSQGSTSVRSPASSDGDAPSKFASIRSDESLRFERNRSREDGNGIRNESLLSRRLMDLAFQKQSYAQYDAE